MYVYLLGIHRSILLLHCQMPHHPTVTMRVSMPKGSARDCCTVRSRPSSLLGKLDQIDNARQYLGLSSLFLHRCRSAGLGNVVFMPLWSHVILRRLIKPFAAQARTWSISILLYPVHWRNCDTRTHIRKHVKMASGS